MKKQLFLAAAIVAMTTSAFATNQTSNTKMAKSANPTISWYITAENPSTTITAGYDEHYIKDILITSKFEISTNQEPWRAKADTATIECGDNSFELAPGSAVVCRLEGGKTVQIHVKKYVHGVEGTYTFLAE